MKGLDFWSQVSHHSLEKHICSRQIIVATWFSSICIQLLLLNNLLLSLHSHNREGGLMPIRLSVCVSKIGHHNFCEFKAYLSEITNIRKLRNCFPIMDPTYCSFSTFSTNNLNNLFSIFHHASKHSIMWSRRHDISKMYFVIKANVFDLFLSRWSPRF